MATEFEPRRFTVEEYELMGEAGVFGPDERTELLDGAIITVPPSSESHSGAINRAVHALVRRFDGRAVIQPQNPVRTNAHSLPEPDIAVLRWDADFYAKRRPLPADVIALIEISRSRLRYDRGPKLLNYARARVPDYWIVNIPEDAIEIYRNPNDLGYDPPLILHRGERSVFAAFPCDHVAADELLP